MLNPMKVAYEHVKRDESSSFYAKKFEDEDFVHSYHVHEECEVVYIKEGRGRLVVGDFSGRFEPGGLYLLGPNLPHAFFSDAAREGGARRVCSLYAQFTPTCFGEGFFDLPEMQSAGKLLRRAARGIEFSGLDSKKAEILLAKLLMSAPMERMARFIELFHLITSGGEQRLLTSEQYVRTEVHRESERLNRAISYIHRSFSGEVMLAAVAAEANLSEAAFSRFFKKSMDQSFIDYLIDLRLSEACRLLLETDMTITEIAYAVGFKNLSNFNRQFLKRKGQTPRSFRKLD